MNVYDHPPGTAETGTAVLLDPSDILSRNAVRCAMVSKPSPVASASTRS